MATSSFGFQRRVYDAIDNLLRQLSEGELEQLRAYLTRLRQDDAAEMFAPICFTAKGYDARAALLIGQESRRIKILANTFVAALYEQVVVTDGAASTQQPPKFLLQESA